MDCMVPRAPLPLLLALTKVFEEVCLRKPQDSEDRTQISAMQTQFAASGYQMKSVFANAANYCKGE